MVSKLKKFLSFVRKALFMVTVVVIAVAFEGCGEVADKTIDEIKYIPAQMFTTRETAETAQTNKRITSPESAVTEYNYIYFRHNNQWVTSRLVSYEVVDNGQNIKFEVDSTMSADRYYYTSMANVMLIHRDEPST